MVAVLSDATEAEAAEWAEYYEIDVDVLADTDNVWLDAWGADGSYHAYTVMDSTGLVTYRKDNGNSASQSALTEALTEA
ncbi:MAG: hypothetical protein GY884_18700, partial [Proteobacteria bacterium]|nr:hypothetical protein [Pseudomonadota bacterium]